MPSAVDTYMRELRDVNLQNDSERFRRNLQRIGWAIGMEISKTLEYRKTEISTPLGNHRQRVFDDEIVLISILRAGLPLHQGLLDVFPHAKNGYISAYRKHHNSGGFEIEARYVACPDLTGKVVVLNDPMLATGSSFITALEILKAYGQPKSFHLAAVIASSQGVDALKNTGLNAQLWVADIDPELNADKYIVPGLGDAGDLAFGPKLQN
ncbi:MAG: uracil phosphoribosyltransferase [Salibacteraceae bacterium]